MTFMRRRESSSSRELGSGSYVGTVEDVARWAAILEFVGAVEWPDGQKRTPGSVVLFVEDGRLKVCLSDKDQGLVGFVTGETLLGVLGAAEEALEADKVDWRVSRQNAPRRRS